MGIAGSEVSSASSGSVNAVSTVGLHTSVVEVCERHESPISLRVVLTEGFGDALDNSTACLELVDYLERQHAEILEEECRIKRDPKHADLRVHACLYVIGPGGMTELDSQAMVALGKRANLVPVVGKADLLTPEELARLKKEINLEIQRRGIEVFDFNGSDDTDYNDVNYNEFLPFAVIGGNCVREVSGRASHFRVYDWADVALEDPKVCDFSLLRSVLFGSHIQELKDATHNVIYERFRTERLMLRGEAR